MLRHGEPVIMNTDQGSQFTSIEFMKTLKDADMQISMDGKGACRDNAFFEHLWRTIKYEEVYLCAYDSVSAARESLGQYLTFYNSRDHTHRWTGKRPIKHISTRRDQPRSQNNRARNPPTKRLETVQMIRTTSLFRACLTARKFNGQ